MWHGLCDSLWNVSSAPWDRRQVLVESWVHRILEAASIDMVYVPPLLAAQVYNVCNFRRNLSWGRTQRYVKIPTRTKKTFNCHRPSSAGLLQTMHVPRDRSGVMSPTYCHCIQFRKKVKRGIFHAESIGVGLKFQFQRCFPFKEFRICCQQGTARPAKFWWSLPGNPLSPQMCCSFGGGGGCYTFSESS